MVFLSWLGGVLAQIISSVISESLNTPAETTNVTTTGENTLPQTPVDQVLEKYKWIQK